MEKRRGAYMVFAGNEGKQLLGRPRNRQRENIKISLQQNRVGGHALN
jgi:hypothetical protein